MHYNHEDENREMEDIGPEEPIGSATVKFKVPMPTIEQVTGEIARQLISSMHYTAKPEYQKRISAALNAAINEKIASKAHPLIDEILSQKLQPTDGFGHPVGDPTSLTVLLAQRVQDWANDMVDSEGKPSTSTYNKKAKRIEWALGQCVNSEMKKLVEAEVKTIVDTLKTSATKHIASQIAEQVGKLVLK